MDATDLAFAGAARQAELVRAGEVGSRELTEAYLERIERIDPQLNSYRVVLAERALAEAEQADRRRAAGEERPLLGVPVAVKDNTDIAGEHTTHGTGAFPDRASADSELVRRLRAAGAVILGKTTLPELAITGSTESMNWGVTRNPWNTDRTCGGSSGGSAAAVAAGLAAAGHATDGAGSIRIPAACCGLFGLKPQRGRVSLMPDAQHWHGMSVAGAVTRTVLDNALFLDVVSGAAQGDAHTPPPPARSFAEAARTPPGALRIAVSARPSMPDAGGRGAAGRTAGDRRAPALARPQRQRSGPGLWPPRRGVHPALPEGHRGRRRRRAAARPAVAAHARLRPPGPRDPALGAGEGDARRGSPRRARESPVRRPRRAHDADHHPHPGARRGVGGHGGASAR